MSTNVELRLTLKNLASAGLKAVAQEQERVAKKSLQNNQQFATQSAAAFSRMNTARERLGIRAEHSIQREIQRTEAAYNRMARAGKLSANEIARAQQASVSKVKELRNELKGVEGGFSRLQKLGFGAALTAGAYSSYAATKNAYEQNLSLDERLGLRANAAFRGKSDAEKRAGEGRMRAGIKTAVAGGLTTDEAMGTLDELIAKNQVGGVDNAIALLPKVAKFKTGQGGSPVEAASLISTLMGGDNPFAKDINQAMRQLDMIAAAGGAGAFETEDLAKHLPNLLALAKTQGYVGDAGLKRVLVMLEQGMTTAGSADESANNLRNLFSKMNAGDTAKDFARMGRGDLEATMLKARAAGKTPDEVYLEVIEQETKNNPKLRAAMKAAAQAKDEAEREERIKAVNELAKGQAIGALFQDMQAKGAFLALLNGAFGKEVEAAINKSSGIVDKDAAYMADKTGFKKRVKDESVKLAQYDAVEKLNPVMNTYYEGMTKLATEYPLLTGSMTLATGAVTALGAAAAYSALQLGGPKLPKIPGVNDKLIKSSKGVIAAAGGSASSAAMLGALPLTAMYGVTQWAGDTTKDKSRASSLLNFSNGISNFFGHDPDAAQKEWRAKKDAELGMVDTKLTINLAPGLVVTKQNTVTTGAVNSSVSTGNIMTGIP